LNNPERCGKVSLEQASNSFNVTVSFHPAGCKAWKGAHDRVE
jgi:hypothetical protein